MAASKGTFNPTDDVQNATCVQEVIQMQADVPLKRTADGASVEASVQGEEDEALSGSTPKGRLKASRSKTAVEAPSYEKKHLTIQDWNEDDRPRERLAKHGAASLTAAELLAILIGSGSTDESAVSLMQKVLASCDNSLSVLGRKSIAELCRFKGIGPAKAITILAACEFANRRTREEALERFKVGSPDDLFTFFRSILGDKNCEECHVLFMNSAHRVISEKQVSSGGLNSASFDVRVILKAALDHSATAIALCHNHPSGNARPSGEDDRATKQLAEACHIMNIQLVDHIIVADTQYYSYADEGKL